MQEILTIMKNELIAMAKSSRIYIGAGLYVISGLIAGLIYILIVRSVEKNVLEIVTKNSGSSMVASKTMSIVTNQSYQRLIEFFAGDDKALIQSLIDVPPIILFTFWGTLTFLPFFIAILSFDQIAADLQHRSISFPLLRCQRWQLYMGKMLSHAGLFFGLTLIMHGVLFIFGSLLLTNFDMASALLFQAKALLLLLPFGLCYVSLVTLISSLLKTPIIALLSSLATLLLLWIISLFSHTSGLSGIGSYLAYLAYLSPSHYEQGLWSPHIFEITKTTVIYLLFASGFTSLGMWRFSMKDL